jgi:hypothetical protein
MSIKIELTLFPTPASKPNNQHQYQFGLEGYIQSSLATISGIGVTHRRLLLALASLVDSLAARSEYLVLVYS